MQTTAVSYSEGKEAIERLTRLVKTIFHVDIAAVSLIDGETQRFQSIMGLPLKEICVEDSFCRAPWRERTTVVIPDTTRNAEFCDHPLVTDAKLKAYAGVPLCTSSGEIIGTICAIHKEKRDFTDDEINVLSDLAQIAATEFELREEANTDPLTHLLTRRAFEKQGDMVLSLARKKGFAVSSVIFDIDWFKQINDRFGHAAGDKVLAAIGNTCKLNLRPHDVLGRIGGEEFAIILTGDVEQAGTTTERLRKAVEALHFRFDEETVHVTASFGVSAINPSENVADALDRADKALYCAKNKGRNTVCVQFDNEVSLSA